jgi:glucose-6-phosphate 1-epimerase
VDVSSFTHEVFGPCIRLTSVDGSSVSVSMHGGHVISWQTNDGQERLFLSSKASSFGAIRGGIPVCFPQFATLGPLPKHGYARTSLWRHRGGGRFVLDVAPGDWSGFDNACALQVEVTLGPAALTVAFSVDNVGPKPLVFSGALHTYLRVADVTDARVDGAGETPIHFGEEFDKSFPNVTEPALLTCGGEPTMLCIQTGFPDIVVWNIGPIAGEHMLDLGVGEWQHYVCIEAASLSAVAVPSGERWTATQTLVSLRM